MKKQAAHSLSLHTCHHKDGRVLSMHMGGGGGGAGGSSPPPPKVPSFSPKRRVAKTKREREEVGNVYYLVAVIIPVNSIPLN